MECAALLKASNSDRLFCSPALKKGSLSCVGCGGSIDEQFYFQVQPDLEWHSRCLKCVHCNQELGTRRSCYVKEGKTYCQEHYNKLFHIFCHACGQMCQSTDLIFRTRGHTFHWECLRCCECHRILQSGDQFSLVCGRIYCLDDYIKLITVTPSNTESPCRNDKANHSAGGDSGIGIEVDLRPPSRNNSKRSLHLNTSATQDKSPDTMSSRTNNVLQIKKEVLSVIMTSEQDKSALGCGADQEGEQFTTSVSEVGLAMVSGGGHILKLGNHKESVETDENNCYSSYCDSLDGDKLMDLHNKDDSYQCDDSPESRFSDCGSDSPEDNTSQEGDSSVVTASGSQQTSLSNAGGRNPHASCGSSKRSNLISHFRHGKESRNMADASGGSGGMGGGCTQTASGGSDSIVNRNRRSKEQKTTRVRTVLNDKQLHTLRTCYGANPRPDALMKEQLVEMTGLSPRVIRVWFQNKRCKDKKRQIMMKQLEIQQQNGSFQRPLTGIAMVASSPTRNDPSLACSNPIEVQQFPAPWKLDFCSIGPGQGDGPTSEHPPPFHQLVRGFHDAYFASGNNPPGPPQSHNPLLFPAMISGSNAPPSMNGIPGIPPALQLPPTSAVGMNGPLSEAAALFYQHNSNNPGGLPMICPPSSSTPNILLPGELPAGSSPHLLNLHQDLN